jgi:hypothetical protein
MLYRMGAPPDARPPRPVAGQYLARNHLSATRRAFLGVEILTGRAQPVNYTDKQVAALVGVSIPYLVAARRVAHSRPDLRSSCESGLVPLLTAVARPGRAERLANAFTKMTAEEQRLFARLAGVDALFNAAVEAA